jgi:hypothetical protein
MKQAERRKYHYIYKITREDGKFYIGMHSTDDLDDGYFGSGQLLWKSIRKHGKEKHTKEILEFLPDRPSLRLREREIVNEELIAQQLCMNLQLGGGGGFKDEEHRKRCTLASLKVLHARFHRGSLDVKERNAKSAATLRARELDYGSGRFHGKRHSPETIEKMKKAHAGKQSGKANSQYGTCWVTNGSPIKIKLSDLDQYLQLGYRRGRKAV